MKANDYRLIARCVEDGIEVGHRRAFKHTDSPPPDHINNAIYEAVMAEVCEWFIFEDVAE